MRPAEPIRIHLMGGIETTGGAPPPSRALALLAALALRVDVAQPRAHLAGLLWPDSEDSQALTNLRRELHGLRATLAGTDSLVVGRTTLAWHETESCRIDVASFLTACGEAFAAMDAGDGDAVRSAARQALTSYQGPLLPGWYDEWVLAAREELHRRCVELCRKGASFCESTGDLAAGLDLARQWCVLDPLDESGYRQLGRLQRAIGDRAGAIRTYQRCTDALEQELGVTPSEQTQREFTALLNPVDTGSPMSVAPRSGRHGRLPELIGRDHEQAQLHEAWQAAQAGCRMVVVLGEPGAGKTRLVSDLAATVRRQQGAVASARCFAGAGDLPLAPVAEWLREPQLARSVSRLPRVWQTEVRRLVPSSADPADGGSDEQVVAGSGRRLRFFEGLARAALGVDRPLLLTLDDLQWSDRTTLAWLAFLLRFGRTAPVLVAATARVDDLARSGLGSQLHTMATSSPVTTVELDPLSASAAAELARQVAGRDLGEEELALVHSLTGDNAFYVVETTREALAAAGPAQQKNLRAVLTGRFERLSEPAQDVAALASAVGRNFDLALLTEASDLDPDLVVRAVDELWHRRILDQHGGGYDFTHDLLRQTAYELIDPARRWLLHRRLAQAMELLHPGRTEAVAAQLAEQYDASGQPDRAIPFYEQAARRAATVFAHAAAVRLGEKSLALLARLPDDADRDERELAVIEGLLPPLNAWRGYAAPELEAYEQRCHELGLRLGRPRVQARAAIALFATTFVQAHTTASSRWAAQALALSEHLPDLSGQAHLGVAGSALSLGQVPLALEEFEIACRLADMDDSLPIGTRTAVHARAWQAHALWLSGEVDDARQTAAQAVADARAVAHPYSLAVALAYAGVLHQFDLDRARLAPCLDELSDLCARHGFAYYPHWGVVLSGWLAGGTGGLTTARSGIDRLRQAGALARMPYWLSLVADLEIGEGERHAAAATLDAATAYAAQNDDVWWLPEVLRLRASLTPERARRDLQEAHRLARAHGSGSLLARSRADLELLGD